jgi:hypothetical protein
MENNESLLPGKLVVQATIEEIWSVGQKLGLVGIKEEEIPKKDDYRGIPTLVTGIKGLARVLGISPSTIVRLKASGEIDDCIFQSGKTVIFDTHKVLDKLRLSNRTTKYHFNKNNYGTKKRKANN